MAKSIKNIAASVEKTFEIRNTLISLNAAVFGPSLGKDGAKNVQCQGFIRKTKLTNAPESFEEVISFANYIKVLVT